MGDNIKKPDHYCEGREYEPKDVIRDWGLNFNLGSCVKYISRAGRKGDKLEDLKKAKQFLQFEIEALAEVEDLKHIVKKIDNDELKCIDIPGNLYCRYRDIRDAIARQALRKVGEKEKSEIGMTCKEAAEIGYAMAKGFEEGFKEDKMEQEDTAKVKKRFVDLNTGKDLWLKQEESDTFTISFKVEED